MITVDKIKFHFLASDLHWAQGLYADWDSFCQNCAIDIIEEVLSSYDVEDSVIEINNLKLNLGDIAQDEFFEEFPIRLRNELHRVLSLSSKSITHSQHTITNNSPLTTHSVQPITHWLSSSTLSRREKIELLTKSLRENPNVVLGFIHNPTDRSLLVTLSDLLESPSVKQIIYVESRSHTEVGIPDYWFSLYEWLYKYYPWGGVAMFGDKESFGRHLNIKLLTFINKLRIGAYLTKSELTIQFILEIFGSEHYLEVLRLIYFNQTLGSDSRPIAGDYYTWEIYYILLKHSIITHNDSDVNGHQLGEQIDSNTSSIESFLGDDSIALSERQSVITQLIIDEPQKVFEWILSKTYRSQTEQAKSKDSLQASTNERNKGMSSSLKQVIKLIDETKLLYLLSSHCSYQVVSIVERVLGYASSLSDTIKEGYYHTIIEWINGCAKSTKYSEPSRAVLQELLSKLQKFTSSINTREVEGAIMSKMHERSAQFTSSLDIEELLSIFNSEDIMASKSLQEICIALTHTEYSYSDRQRIYINLLSRYGEAKLLLTLEDSELLDNFVQTLPRDIIRVLLLRLAQDNHLAVRNLVDWVVTNDDTISEILGCSSPTLLRSMIAMLRVWSVERSNTNSDETTICRAFIRGIILDRGDESRVISELTELSRRTNTQIFNLMLRFEESDVTYLDEVIRTQENFNIVEWFSKQTMFYNEGLCLHPDIAVFGDDVSINTQQAGQVKSYYEYLTPLRKALAMWRGDTLKTTITGRVNELHKVQIVKLYIRHYPYKFLTQLRPLSKQEVISLARDSAIDREDILSCGRSVDSSISITLRGVAQKIEESVTRWGVFSGSSYELSTSISTAMLLLLVEIHDSGRSIDSEYIISRFFSLWHFVLTGEESIDSSPNWQSAMNEVTHCELIVETADKIEEVKEDAKYSHLAPDNFEEFKSWLLSDIVEDSKKCDVIGYYIKETPRALLDFIRYSVSNDRLLLRRLSRSLSVEGLICLCASISYQLFEALYYLYVYVRNSRSIPEWELFEKIAHFILNHNESDLRSYSIETLTRKVAEHFNIETELLNQNNEIKEKLFQEVVNEEDIKIEPQYISTPCAGLALLAPWFARLFGMVGLLDKDNKYFKSDEAKIRGIFILQRLSSPEQRKWRDSELALSRILVGLPFSKPLPTELELYKEEVEAIESMLAGVKAYWKVLANTSVEGFQSSFISRSGRIERRENSWLLRVEPRSYDMLLDSLPWSYTPIRLPWLKEWIDVIWREIQEFDC